MKINPNNKQRSDQGTGNEGDRMTDDAERSEPPMTRTEVPMDPLIYIRGTSMESLMSNSLFITYA